MRSTKILHKSLWGLNMDIKQDIIRLEEKVDKGFLRIDNKFDDLIFMISKKELDEATRLVVEDAAKEARLQVVEATAKEYHADKSFWKNKTVDMVMKGLIALALAYLGFKESITKVFGF